MARVGREPASAGINRWRGRYAPTATSGTIEGGRMKRRYHPTRYRYNPPGRTLGGRYKIGQTVEEIEEETRQIRRGTRKTHFLILGVLGVAFLWDLKRRRRK